MLEFLAMLANELRYYAQWFSDYEDKYGKTTYFWSLVQEEARKDMAYLEANGIYPFLVGGNIQEVGDSMYGSLHE